MDKTNYYSAAHTFDANYIFLFWHLAFHFNFNENNIYSFITILCQSTKKNQNFGFDADFNMANYRNPENVHIHICEMGEKYSTMYKVNRSKNSLLQSKIAILISKFHLIS